MLSVDAGQTARSPNVPEPGVDPLAFAESWFTNKAERDERKAKIPEKTVEPRRDLLPALEQAGVYPTPPDGIGITPRANHDDWDLESNFLDTELDDEIFQEKGVTDDDFKFFDEPGMDEPADSEMVFEELPTRIKPEPEPEIEPEAVPEPPSTPRPELSPTAITQQLHPHEEPIGLFSPILFNKQVDFSSKYGSGRFWFPDNPVSAKKMRIVPRVMEDDISVDSESESEEDVPMDIDIPVLEPELSVPSKAETPEINPYEDLSEVERLDLAQALAIQAEFDSFSYPKIAAAPEIARTVQSLYKQATRSQAPAPRRAEGIWKIFAPLVRLQRGGSGLDIDPAAVAFWDTFGLGPFDGPRNITASVVCPDQPGIVAAAEAFLVRITSAYESCRLGSHKVEGVNTSAKTDVVYVVESDARGILLPLDFIYSPLGLVHRSQQEYVRLACQIYQRFGRLLTLAPALPKTIVLKPGEKRLPMSDDLQMYVAYASNGRWVSVGWTDNCGTVQQAVPYLGKLEQVLPEIMRTTVDLLPPKRPQGMVLLSKLGKFEPGELKLWHRAAAMIKKLTVRVFAFEIDFPDIGFETTLPIDPLAFASVPSTPQITSPETPASHNAPTPTDQPQEDVPERLTDKNDVWLAAVKEDSVLARGYLITREGAILGCSLVQAQGIETYMDEPFLKKCLSKLGELTYLARCKGAQWPWNVEMAAKIILKLSKL